MNDIYVSNLLTGLFAILLIHQIRIQSLKRDEVQTRHAYECPLYKTARRHGSIDTAGHHSNFVISIPLNCSPGSDIGHWIRRGCALLCQLSS